MICLRFYSLTRPGVFRSIFWRQSFHWFFFSSPSRSSFFAQKYVFWNESTVCVEHILFTERQGRSGTSHFHRKWNIVQRKCCLICKFMVSFSAEFWFSGKGRKMAGNSAGKSTPLPLWHRKASFCRETSTEKVLTLTINPPVTLNITSKVCLIERRRRQKKNITRF